MLKGKLSLLNIEILFLRWEKNENFLPPWKCKSYCHDLLKRMSNTRKSQKNVWTIFLYTKSTMVHQRQEKNTLKVIIPSGTHYFLLYCSHLNEENDIFVLFCNIKKWNLIYFSFCGSPWTKNRELQGLSKPFTSKKFSFTMVTIYYLVKFD